MGRSGLLGVRYKKPFYMSTLPFSLVLISAVTHGLWNFLAKRANNKDVFIGLSKVTESLLFLLPFLVVLAGNGYGAANWPLFVAIAAGFVFLNYFFLSQAYKQIELSIAYPISRASTLFLPLLAFLFIGERLDGIGWIAIVLITLAIFILQLQAFSWDEVRLLGGNLVRPGIIFALLAALMAASYTIWDKVAVSYIHPFLYFYSYTFLTSFFYAGLLTLRFERTAVVQEWRQHKQSIIAVAILNTFTYLLVLIALNISKASYVGTLRQVSLVVGVLLGWHYLGENIGKPKLVSIGLLLFGSILIALAR